MGRFMICLPPSFPNGAFEWCKNCKQCYYLLLQSPFPFAVEPGFHFFQENWRFFENDRGLFFAHTKTDIVYCMHSAGAPLQGLF